MNALDRPSLRRRLLQAAVAVSAWGATNTALAVDPFEIQVYDGTANGPGVPGLELHLNTVLDGLKSAPPPELPPHHQSHVTLEPSIGMRPWWELGGYLQSTLTADGRYRYSGVKLRSKFVTPPGWRRHWRLGVNFEVSLLPEAYDRDRWGGEVRPIVAWESPHWIFVVNPIVELSFAGPDAHEGPHFAPAAMAKFKIRSAVALGLEYYSDLGPFSDPAPLREQQHYLFEAFDILNVHRWELNGGVGEGLNASSNAFVVKAILGYSFEP